MPIKFEDMPKDERDALNDLYNRRASCVSDEMRSRLKAQGLATDGLGGIIISRTGEQVIAAFLLARKKRREQEGA